MCPCLLNSSTGLSPVFDCSTVACTVERKGVRLLLMVECEVMK